MKTQQADASEMGEKKKKEDLGRAIGRIASGVFVVTMGNENERDGLLATWINQTSFEPPMVAVAVNKGRHIMSRLTPGTVFAVNVLSKKNKTAYKNFVQPYTEGLDRFLGVKLLPGVCGAPVLAESVAYLLCQVRHIADGGDHNLVIAETLEGDVLNPEDEPMIHLRKNGFQY